MKLNFKPFLLQINVNICIASNLRQQAAKMDAEAKGLMAEAQRLQKEAAQLEGVTTEVTKPNNIDYFSFFICKKYNNKKIEIF